MRILMVLDHPFPPDARVSNEAESLLEAGFEVVVLAISPDERPARERMGGLEIIRDRLHKELRNKMRGLAGTVPFLSWYVAWRVGQCYRERPFDAIHAHDLYLFGGALRAGRRLNVPVVGDLHENWVEALKHYAWSSRFPGRFLVSIPRWERLERRWVNAVDRLVVVIEEAAERNVALGVPPARIAVVPNTIKRSVFAGYGEEPAIAERIRSPFTITYTGGFDLHRGLSSVIEALPRVLERIEGARLVLVGEGRIRSELEELAARLGVRDHVLFEGWQPEALLKSYILGSDACLVPHLKTVHTDNTIPHKLFHYMYFGRPVVVSNCRPLERIVGETGAGVVFEAGNPTALAGALLQVASDREEAQRMGERGHRAVMDRYNWDETVQPLVRLYRELEASR